MMNIQGMLIGGAVLALAAFTAGMKVGGDGEARNTERKVAAVRVEAAKLIDAEIQKKLTGEAERDQCKAEVAKYNTETVRLSAEAELLRQADQAKRDEAIARGEQASASAARQLRELNAQVASTLEVLRNVGDECARAPVSDDARRLLNGILSTKKTGVDNR